MIDRVMELPEYRFYCHEQIRAELARHDIGDSPEWLETKISDGAVHCMVWLLRAGKEVHGEDLSISESSEWEGIYIYGENGIEGDIKRM